MAGTADVTVEADHLMGGAHHQVQIVDTIDTPQPWRSRNRVIRLYGSA